MPAFVSIFTRASRLKSSILRFRSWLSRGCVIPSRRAAACCVRPLCLTWRSMRIIISAHSWRLCASAGGNPTSVKTLPERFCTFSRFVISSLWLDTGCLDHFSPRLDFLLEESLHGLRAHFHGFGAVGGEYLLRLGTVHRLGELGIEALDKAARRAGRGQHRRDHGGVSAL